MDKSIESILTRLISIAAKFALVTFLAKVLPLSEYGSYQLVTYFVMISIYVFGLEYYMYGNREVAKGVNSLEKINTHVNFFITLLPITFVIQLVALFLLIPLELLSPFTVCAIVIISMCDYFNQEVYRYLLMIQKITKANLLLIAKSSIFVLTVVGYYLFKKELNFDTTLGLMLVAYGLLFVVTTLYFYKDVIAGQALRIKRLPKAELYKIVKFLSPFLGLMVATKGLEFFDKFALEHQMGTNAVGIYAFLFAIASLMHVFVISGFYVIYLPQMIQLYEKKDAILSKVLKKFSLLVIGSSIILALGIILGIDILLQLIGKTELINNKEVLYALLGAFFLLNCSLIPRILLYVVHKDKTLMYITIAIFLLNVVLNLILLPYFEILGVALALLGTYLVGFGMTSYYANNTWKELKRSFL